MIPPRRHRVLALAAAATSGIALAVTIASPASATVAMSATGTNVTLVAPGSTTTLNGLSVSGDPTDQLAVTLSTDSGSIALPTHTNLTLDVESTAWSGREVTFDGLEADVNAALATATFTAAGSTGTAHIGLVALIADPDVHYLADTGHFYQYVSDNSASWTDADGFAQGDNFHGQNGYLATIPDARVNSFVTTLQGSGRSVWFGARSYESDAMDGTEADAVVNGVTYGRVWRWTIGAGESPRAGGILGICTQIAGGSGGVTPCDFVDGSSYYQSWDNGEPNNNVGTVGSPYSGEWVAMTGFAGVFGKWNDFNDAGGASQGYLVEYGDSTDALADNGFDGSVAVTHSTVAIATPPAAPAISAGAVSGGTTVTWPAAPSDNGSAITGYEYSVDGGTTWHTATVTGTGPYSTTITGLTPGSSYRVLIRADNASGAGTASVVATVTVPPVLATALSIRKVAGSDRVLTVQFDPPANDGGSVVTGYQISLDDGKTWQTATITGSGHLLATVRGALDGKSYAVKVRAVTAAGKSPASGVRKYAMPQWFADPVSAAARKAELSWIAAPASYRGPFRPSTSTMRTYKGLPAMTVGAIRGRQLQPGEAASLGIDALFGYNSAELNRAGAQELRKLVGSLRYDHAVTCEGYTDYGGESAHESALSKARAQAVCQALKADGAKITIKLAAYGSKKPVVIGAVPATRSANRRVVILVTA